MKVGMRTTYRRRLEQVDIDGFADLSGDTNRNHVDPEYMRTTPYGGTIAHGALMVAFMTGAAHQLLERNSGEIALADLIIVSYGYDRVRFVRAARPGDDLSISYEVVEIDEDDHRAVADVRVTNQRDEVVAVARHISKLSPRAEAHPVSESDAVRSRIRGDDD
ncbi:MaoC family dehydratase [Microbacterium sp. CPCC 204701]|uniref:MaoC family dehydratase n=1 Tax=Microbacterium sp. CPCC 204701 TaxID=2493084 RepID=UPI000FD6E45D|nr:MaoC family dehydratase [Microbacterium sp. CPCC 204701]